MNKVIEAFVKKAHDRTFDEGAVVKDLEELRAEVERITKMSKLPLKDQEDQGGKLVGAYVKAFLSAMLATHPSITMMFMMEPEVATAIGAAIMLGIGMAREEGLLVLPDLPVE